MIRQRDLSGTQLRQDLSSASVSGIERDRLDVGTLSK
jgi:hypothetical protein